jgi:Fe-S oxidoreductase
LQKPDGDIDIREVMAEAIRKSRAFLCYECGKCSGICPVARFDSSFSPRSLLIRATRGEIDKLIHDQTVWSCLTCGLCDTRCPVGIDYGLLTKVMRTVVRREGGEGTCTHGGAVQSLTRIMKAKQLKQDRLGWVDSSLKTKTKSDTVYFVGCAPYFDVLFSETGAKPLDGPRGAVRLLNAAGITPALLPNERCCGHDMLWSGDVEGFLALAGENLKMLEEAGTKRVVFSCPEGYALFKTEYPAHFGPLPFEVVHITEVLADDPRGHARGDARRHAQVACARHLLRRGQLDELHVLHETAPGDEAQGGRRHRRLCPRDRLPEVRDTFQLRVERFCSEG